MKTTPLAQLSFNCATALRYFPHRVHPSIVGGQSDAQMDTDPPPSPPSLSPGSLLQSASPFIYRPTELTRDRKREREKREREIDG
ncbi:hypothetical protein T03_1839 [Trichinella britovi]|uniref:Uncharacterized protein n=1 Tax=Trichinella britovi TaxID=45882 RepID=A0A0V1DB67_TRIBR|nr:hypothetical protein T03_1839 [Trichinella britovi]